MNIDLDENNYDYEKLLDLFSLDQDFDKSDLKIAKLKVLKLHPDRCELPKEYFIFFRKMYFKLEEIYNYMNHETDEENLKKSVDIDTKFKDYLEKNNIDPIKNYKTFTREFNRMFEKVYISEDNEGYKDWLKSEDNMYDMNDLEKSRKKAIQQNALIKKEEKLEEVGMFNNKGLNCYDVKESHGNPFIAMDINDIYNKKPKFNSVQEYQQFIAKEDKKNKPLSFDQSMDYLNQKEDLLNNQAKQLAYNNMKRKEKMENNYNQYISTYLKLNN